MRAKMLAAAAALSMLMTSTAVTAQSAASPTIAPSVRAGEDTRQASELGTDFAIIFVVVAMTIAGLFVVAGGGDGADSP